MEGNGLSGDGGLFLGMGSGMLGLEMPLHPQSQHHHQQQQQNPSNPYHLHHQHPQMVVFAIAHQETDQNPQNQQSVKHNYPHARTRNQQQLVHSDEDEPVGDDGDGKRKVSPWQRMKWTDSMVRLLIMAVFYIGDDQAGSEAATDAAGKKKAGGMLLKKGKWKSVSRAMKGKGFYVSPQQCEDKFNDLNKRYKRVNDILGKGTSCQVVENQSLLNSMDNLSPKVKEEVRKLLNSKHLFFREMCAYHNSCGGGSGAAGALHSAETAAGQSHHQHQCHHSPDNAAVVSNSAKTETQGSKMPKERSGEEEDDEDGDEDDDYEDEDDDDDEEEMVEGGVRPHNDHPPNDDDERSSRKRQRKGLPVLQSPLIQQLSNELMSLLQDGSKDQWEKRQWMKTQQMKLEEQRVSYQWEAFELEKQRLKWVKFSSKKEREMERAKLKNERTRIESERMLLLLQHKELELIELHHHQQCSNKRGDPSSITG